MAGRRKKKFSRRVLNRLSSVRLRVVLAVAGVFAVLGVGATGTWAYWTDSATVQGGTFQAGTLDIKLGDPAVDANPQQFDADFEMSDMVPGSTKDAVLKVSNSGTLPFTFKVNGTATNNGPTPDQMGSAIRLAVYPAASSSGACSGVPIALNLTPTGPILSEQPVLAASATRDLCFRATLPPGAATDLQGKSTVITFTFTAKQVGAP